VRLRRLAYVIAALGVALLVALWLRSILATRSDSPSRLFGNGVIEATEVDISAKIAGKIEALDVQEGDVVAKDQLIALLDGQELAAQVEQAEASLRGAEAALAELRAGTRPEDLRRARAQHQAALDAEHQAAAHLALVKAGTRSEQIEQLRALVRQAEVALTDAETELKRAQALEAEGAVAGQQVDQARTRRDTAAAQLDASHQRLAEAETGSRPEDIRAAEAALSQAHSQAQAARAALDLAVAGPRPETIAAAEARVEQARAALTAAQVQQAYTLVRSPTTGTVTLRNVEPGELVTPGLPIIRVAALDRVWLKVYLPQPQLGRIKLGQTAEVTADTYPRKSYPGRVIQIAQEPEFTPKNVQTREERVKLVFGIKIELENPGGELKPGMPADAVVDVGPPPT
jgi:multidrug resistance efflux pump